MAILVIKAVVDLDTTSTDIELIDEVYRQIKIQLKKAMHYT